MLKVNFQIPYLIFMEGEMVTVDSTVISGVIKPEVIVSTVSMEAFPET